ncbi:MAG: hypothetical protein ACI30A_03170 [Paludibacteraceae bacterium]
MRKIVSVLCVLSLCLSAMAATPRERKANKDTDEYRYEIECAGNAVQGTYLVKVWSYSKKAAVAEHQCRKNAVHGVIFKGYGGGQSCVAQRPLCNTPGAEVENETYFKSFFSEGGEFQKYASIVAGTTEITKVGREYKVGVIVSVRKDDLRKALEAAGVIRALNAGF